MSDPFADARAAPLHSRRFWVNLTFLCAVLGLCEAARGIVLPTLSLYVASLGGSSAFLSVIVAAFSVGRLSSSVVLGYVSDHCGIQLILMASLAITCAGHILFVCADGLNSGGLYLLLISRALTGFGTGTLSVCRAFVSKNTEPSERTRFMSWLGIVQFAGYAFTPIVGGLAVSWPITVSWRISTFTAGTYALLLLDVALLVGLYFGLRGQAAEMEAERTAVEAMCIIAAEAKSVALPAAAEQVEQGDDVDVMVEPRAAVEPTTSRRSKGDYAALDNEDHKLDNLEADEPSVSASHTAQSQSAHSVATPRALAASQPPTPSGRSTSAPTGLTASSFATLSVPSMPRDVFSSDTLDLLRTPVLPPPPPPSVSPVAGEPAGADASSAWERRLANMRARLSYYSTAAFLVPVFFLLLNAASRGCLAVAETYGATLHYSVEYGDHYNPATVSPLGAAWFYPALGVVGVLVFVLMDTFTHYLNELTLLCWGFIAMCLGFTTVLDTDNSIVNLAFSMSMIYCIATPITQTLVSSMLSKQLSAQQQGKWMGLLTAAGSVGRIVFPLLSGALYSLGATNAALLLPAVAAMCAVSALVVGLKVWQLWWAYWVRVERRLELWQERRAAGRVRRTGVRRDSLQELEEDWLTIEEVVERLERRAKAKARRKRRKRERHSAGALDPQPIIESSIRDEQEARLTTTVGSSAIDSAVMQPDEEKV